MVDECCKSVRFPKSCLSILELAVKFKLWYIFLLNLPWVLNCRVLIYDFNPYPAKVIYLNFQPHEVVSRYRDTQLQVAENYSYLFNLSTNICTNILMFRHTLHSQ